MTLGNTIEWMISLDYKERFKAEYYQLKIRLEKLKRIYDMWDLGKLEFTPSVPMEVYVKQISAMTEYLTILEKRAKIEQIEL